MVKIAKTQVCDLEETEAFFQGKDEREKVAFYFHQHWIRLMPSFAQLLMFTAVIAGLLYLFFGFVPSSKDDTGHLLLAMFVTGFSIIQLLFLLRLYHYFLYIVIVTDRKIHRIKKTLFSIDDHESIDIANLQDIDKTQRGLIQNIFGFGSLQLEAQNTIIRIHFIPRIEKIYHEILHIRENIQNQHHEHRHVQLQS